MTSRRRWIRRTTTCRSDWRQSSHAAALGAILAAAACVVPARAQSTPDRLLLEQLRRDLAQASQAEAALAAGRTPPASASAALRAVWRGFVAVRVGELTRDRRSYDEAILRFDEATRRAPAWPYSWFGLAVSKLALSRLDVLTRPSLHQPDGVSYYLGFTQAIGETFSRDSLFPPAMALLRTELAVQGEREQPEVLLRALARAARQPTAEPTEFLVLARAARARLRNDSALVLLDAFRERGGDPGVAALERAHTLALLDSLTVAAETWQRGLEHPSPAARAAYRHDIGWIAEAGELAAFDRVPDDSLGEWTAEFWRVRDARELRLPGERLLEHLRRWAFVHRHFRVVHPERRTQFAHDFGTTVGPCTHGDYLLIDNVLGDSTLRPADGRRRERVYDDRAYLYMRHGEPARRVQSLVQGQIAATIPDQVPRAVDAEANRRTGMPSGAAKPTLANLMLLERLERARANESWLYWFSGEPRIFHFEGGERLGLGGPSTLVALPLPDPGWLAARALLDARYQTIANRLGHGSLALECTRLWREVAEKNRTDVTVGLRTDSYTLLFRHDLSPVVQVYAVGRPALGTARLLVVFALPRRQLTPEPAGPGAPPGVLYPVTTRVSAIDPARHITRGLDSSRTFHVADTLRRGTHLTGYVELPVPPGRYDVGTVLFQVNADAGGSIVRSGLDLRLPADSLYLSDLVLGRDGSGLVWQDGEDRIPLNPLGAFSRSAAAEVFYELSGLEPGRTYVTTMRLTPLKGDTTEGVQLQFGTAAEGMALRVRRSLGLERLTPGQYRLQVEVAESGGFRGVRREQTLTVIE